MQKPVRLQSDSKWSIHRSRCNTVSTWIETTTNGNVESLKKMNPRRTCLNTTTWLLYHTGQIAHVFFFFFKNNTPDVYAASAAASQSFIALNQVDSKCLQSSCLSLTCQDKIRIRPKQIYSNLFVNLWSHLQRMTKKNKTRCFSLNTSNRREQWRLTFARWPMITCQTESSSAGVSFPSESRYRFCRAMSVCTAWNKDKELIKEQLSSTLETVGTLQGSPQQNIYPHFTLSFTLS